MVFDLERWNTVSSGARRGDANSVYSYNSADTVATMLGPAYLDSIANRLSIGDLIVARSTTDNISEFFIVTAVHLM